MFKNVDTDFNWNHPIFTGRQNFAGIVVKYKTGPKTRIATSACVLRDSLLSLLLLLILH